MAGLFKNEPFPSQRIQLNPSKIPTKIGHSVVTEKRPSFERRKAEDYKIRAATGQSSIRKFTPSLPQIGLAGGDHSFSPLQRANRLCSTKPAPVDKLNWLNPKRSVSAPFAPALLKS